MQKRNYRGVKCEKRLLSKCQGVCRTFNAVQSKFADLLQENPDIESFRCNVYLKGLDIGGLSMTHSSVKRLLQNKHYLGDEFYPAIIDRETFDAAEAERLRRVELSGRRFTKKTVVEQRRISTCFTIGAITEEHEDPYEQAAYIYSLVESEGQQWHQ